MMAAPAGSPLRTLVALLVAAAVVAVGWAGLAGTAAPAAPSPSAAAPAPAPSPSPAGAPTADVGAVAVAPPVAPAADPGLGRAPAPSAGDLDGARDAAAAFAEAYATYLPDDGPGALARRAGPFATADLAAALARDGTQSAGWRELAERGSQASARTEAVHLQAAAEGSADLLVVLRQEVTWTGGGEVRWPSYLTRVELTDAGWRVAGFSP